LETQTFGRSKSVEKKKRHSTGGGEKDSIRTLEGEGDIRFKPTLKTTDVTDREPGRGSRIKKKN